MSAHAIENGRRVTVGHASALPRAALVEANGKASVAWRLIDPRAALPAPGNELEIVEADGTARRARVLALDKSKAAATAHIEFIAE